MRSVFIIGEQRSGSNLLRLMLSQAGIAAPHPPHILTRLLPLEPSYGDLQQDPNWAQLVEDVCQLVDRNPVPWTGVVPVDRAAVRARCRERSTVAAFGAVMDLYAEASGASAWACKSMQVSELVDDLDAYFPDAKYLYLHRDPRDVVLSFQKAVVGEKHPFFIAKKWARLQAAARNVEAKVGPERCFRVGYEALLADPEPLLRSLCAFLEVEFRPAMMDFHQSREAQSASSSSQLWQNVGRPLLKDNARKFLRGLTEADIRLVESVAGPELDALGYDRVHVPPGEERRYTAEEVSAFTQENERLKGEHKAVMDADDAERRARQLAVLTDRVAYLDDLSQPDKLTLLAHLEEQHVPAGTLLIEKGAREEDLYFIVEGEVEVLEDEAALAVVSRGECVGEIGLLSGLPRTRTLRTKTATRLLRLSRVTLQQLMVSSPQVAARLLWVIGARLAQRFAEGVTS
jgi:LPS sulfotransferase NodH